MADATGFAGGLASGLASGYQVGTAANRNTIDQNATQGKLIQQQRELIANDIKSQEATIAEIGKVAGQEKAVAYVQSLAKAGLLQGINMRLQALGVNSDVTPRFMALAQAAQTAQEAGQRAGTIQGVTKETAQPFETRADIAAAPGQGRAEAIKTVSTTPAKAAQAGAIATAQVPAKNAELTPLQKELAAAGYQPGTDPFQKTLLGILAKPQTQVTLASEGALAKGLGEGLSKQLITQRQGALDAAEMLKANARDRQILAEPVITGAGANFVLEMGKILQQAGVHLADDAIANTEAYVASRARATGQLIKQFGSGTGLSDADRAYAEKAAGGNVTMTKQSIEKILDISDKASRNVISTFNTQIQSLPKTAIPEGFNFAVPVPAPTAGPNQIKFLGFE